MNCQDIENLLDSGEVFALTPARQADARAHLLCCERCKSEWRAARALRQSAARPTPAPRPELFAETMRLATSTIPRVEGAVRRQPSFWLGAGVGGALAAGIAIAIMSFTMTPRLVEQADAAPSITIALNEPRDIGVAIDSVEALKDAEIRVVLTGGVRLAGLSDRTMVSWRTDLDRGVNRLTLPVVAVNRSGGQVLVEVEHGSKRQVFLVKVGVDADGVAVARPAGSMHVA